MSELQFKYSIRSALPPHVESPAVLGAKFLNTLDALSHVDPTIFTNWEIMDFSAKKLLPLTAVRPRIAAIIGKNAKRDDSGSDPEAGYHLVASTSGVPASRGMSIRITTGGIDKGEIMLETGDYKVLPDPMIVTYPVFRSALLAINAIWPAPWACAYAFRLDYYEVPLFSGAPLFPYTRFHIPWLAYLSAPLAAGLELPPEIPTERTADGGLLTIATEERLDPTNPEHLRRARVLADTLIARTGYSSP
jgi:hypothetical protein